MTAKSNEKNRTEHSILNGGELIDGSALLLPHVQIAESCESAALLGVAHSTSVCTKMFLHIFADVPLFITTSMFGLKLLWSKNVSHAKDEYEYFIITDGSAIIKNKINERLDTYYGKGTEVTVMIYPLRVNSKLYVVALLRSRVLHAIFD